MDAIDFTSPPKPPFFPLRDGENTLRWKYFLQWNVCRTWFGFASDANVYTDTYSPKCNSNQVATSFTWRVISVFFFLAGPPKVPGWSPVRDPPSYAPHCSVRFISVPRLRWQLPKSAGQENASASSPSGTPDSTRWWWYWFRAPGAAGKDWYHVRRWTAWENK